MIAVPFSRRAIAAPLAIPECASAARLTHRCRAVGMTMEYAAALAWLRPGRFTPAFVLVPASPRGTGLVGRAGFARGGEGASSELLGRLVRASRRTRLRFCFPPALSHGTGSSAGRSGRRKEIARPEAGRSRCRTVTAKPRGGLVASLCSRPISPHRLLRRGEVRAAGAEERNRSARALVPSPGEATRLGAARMSDCGCRLDRRPRPSTRRGLRCCFHPSLSPPAPPASAGREAESMMEAWRVSRT